MPCYVAHRSNKMPSKTYHDLMVVVNQGTSQQRQALLKALLKIKKERAEK